MDELKLDRHAIGVVHLTANDALCSRLNETVQMRQLMLQAVLVMC